jgi:hypothetical protein
MARQQKNDGMEHTPKCSAARLVVEEGCSWMFGLTARERVF